MSDIPRDIDQAASRIAGEFLAYDVSCERIYKLVAAALIAERERCALIAEGRNPLYATTGHNGRLICNEIASSIRQGAQPSNAVELRGTVS